MTGVLSIPGPDATFDEVAAFWQEQPLFAELDIRLEALQRGHVRLAIHRNDRSVGGIRNSINGGVLATLAEIAAHLCVRTAMERGSRVLRTQDVGISYVASAVAERTVAEARLLRAGRTSVVAVEIRDGDDGHMNCHARVSCLTERDASRSAG